jgi:hypothetical protein
MMHQRLTDGCSQIPSPPASWLLSTFPPSPPRPCTRPLRSLSGAVLPTLSTAQLVQPHRLPRSLPSSACPPPSAQSHSSALVSALTSLLLRPAMHRPLLVPRPAPCQSSRQPTRQAAPLSPSAPRTPTSATGLPSATVPLRHSPSSPARPPSTLAVLLFQLVSLSVPPRLAVRVARHRALALV